MILDKKLANSRWLAAGILALVSKWRLGNISMLPGKICPIVGIATKLVVWRTTLDVAMPRYNIRNRVLERPSSSSQNSQPFIMKRPFEAFRNGQHSYRHTCDDFNAVLVDRHRNVSSSNSGDTGVPGTQYRTPLSPAAPIV
jgi:hypothetical protein